MPPALPRPSPSLLSRGAASVIPFSPTSAAAPRSPSASSRPFSSAVPRCASRRQRIPPESPRFINVPNPPQDQSIEARRELKPIKGHLPVPRPIFKHPEDRRKVTDAWLRAAAPLPTPGSKSGKAETPSNSAQAWKRLMAETRRSNLRDGVRRLYDRHRRLQRQRRERQITGAARARAAAEAPEREDERLTATTVNAGTLQTAVILDPLRFERALESRERTNAVAQRRSEARRDALQELYMRARSFIVTEEQLEAEVSRLFSPTYWKDQGLSSSGFEITNVWDLHGRPKTVADMFTDISRNSSTLLKNYETDKTRTLKRQKEVAEELTGGKLDGT
ncbi:hypothetical protein GGS23DRAFT_345943 [Durotheca rogersii]|uniref:uncharacterized protein n=1 Tax=Durotheca rogersii TaxID=419775 RepID=UPI0022209344|nr:uncharacterized protein GGS23DRAFT_345943 [Durotheca rogersii]KAI5857369.1 hypothetical protein GGS23DRAFT_345943 [Durotheca rogersii]